MNTGFIDKTVDFVKGYLFSPTAEKNKNNVEKDGAVSESNVNNSTHGERNVIMEYL